MTTLYFTSIEAFSGKTALCVGIGKRLLRDGFSVGYMKPISTTARRVEGKVVDEDAEFIKELFGLAEPSEVIAPISLASEVVEAVLSGEEEDFGAVLKDAYSQVSRGKDVVLLEGGANPLEGCLIGLPTYRVARILGANVMVVSKYTDDLVVESLLGAKEIYGDSMLGAVINAVPRRRLRFVEVKAKPYLEERGVMVFAVLPEERLLASISVKELAECLDGEVLCCQDKVGELVEYLMVGAMTMESALSYFRRKPNKAVITGGDRPDIQLAALETSTKCLVLTGNLRPSPIVLGRAEDVGVPMILVNLDTLTTVEVIGRFFGKTRFHQERKIKRFEEMLEERFDFESLYECLGLR
jgi:hypothetical protein